MCGLYKGYPSYWGLQGIHKLDKACYSKSQVVPIMRNRAAINRAQTVRRLRLRRTRYSTMPWSNSISSLSQHRSKPP